MNFEGKTFVVTGGASGIGRGLAIRLMERGGSVAIADMNEDGLAETADIARKTARSNSRITTHKLNVASLEDWQAFRTSVIEEHGHIDGIINNAGVAMGVSAVDMTYDELDWMMSINFNGMVFGTKEFLPHLMDRPEAAIANVSSVFGLFGVPGQAAYNASKFAIRGYTEALAQDLADTNVHVASIHPGHIGTNIAASARIAEANKEEGITEEERNAMGKMFREQGLDPKQAADIILDGIARGDRKILVGKDARRWELLNRVAPNWFSNLFGSKMRAMSETKEFPK